MALPGTLPPPFCYSTKRCRLHTGFCLDFPAACPCRSSRPPLTLCSEEQFLSDLVAFLAERQASTSGLPVCLPWGPGSRGSKRIECAGMESSRAACGEGHGAQAHQDCCRAGMCLLGLFLCLAALRPEPHFKFMKLVDSCCAHPLSSLLSGRLAPLPAGPPSKLLAPCHSRWLRVHPTPFALTPTCRAARSTPRPSP